MASQRGRSSSSPGNHASRLELMNELMEEVMEIDRQLAPTIESVNEVKRIVVNSYRMVEESDPSSGKQLEMSIDGRIFDVGQNVFQNAVKNLDTNLMPFSLDDYVRGIHAFLDTRTLSGERDWEEMSGETFFLFQRSAVLDFKLGTFELDPPPPPSKTAKERQKRAPKTEKAIVKAVESQETANEPQHYGQHILEHLTRLFVNNNKKPINYFEFVLDPTDFWRSVHNVYHFAHLAKDSKVKMALDERGLPVIMPMRKEELGQEPKQSRQQYNFRMTPVEYRELLKTFNIKKAAIPPLGKPKVVT